MCAWACSCQVLLCFVFSLGFPVVFAPCCVRLLFVHLYLVITCGMQVELTRMAMMMNMMNNASSHQPLVSATLGRNSLHKLGSNCLSPFAMNSSAAGTHGQFYFPPGLEPRGESAGNSSRAQSSEFWPGRAYGSS